MLAQWPILRIKLSPPPLRGSLARPRLLARLDEGRTRRLTLLVAPAGYGKTTLLSQWVSQQAEGQRAWCTLEENEANLSSFLAYLSAALAPVVPQATAHAQELLADLQAGLDSVLPLLLDGLAALDHPLVLALDDVQCVERSVEVLEALDRLLRHAPRHLHLILSARREPPLPSIPRLRAMGQVIELTEAELRFTPAEIARLFATVFDFALDEETATQLAARTEGWAVALQLAYQTGARYGPAEAERMLRRFGGTTRQLYDYLARVVLEGQPEETRIFLRRTAILERLEPALCDALLERDDSTAMLAHLEQAGLFTFTLDATRTVYRYHALFREFLQRRLLEVEGATAVHQLHRRAAAWFLERGDDEAAIVHLLAAEDYPAAADLVRPLRKRLFATSRYHRLERWLEQFPPSIAEAHPWLLLTRARLHLLRGDRNAAERLYREVEPLLRAQQDAEGLYILYHDLASIVRAHRGDFVAAETLERQALAWAPTDEDRATSLSRIARCRYMTQGAEQEVFDLLEQAMDLAQKGGYPLVRADLLSLRGQIHTGLGDLTAALEDFHRALELMEACGNRHSQLSILANAAYHHYLLGQLDQAEALIQRDIELAQTFRRETYYAYAINLRGFLHQARGELEAARRDHEEALTIQQRLGEEYEVAVTLNWLGLLARREGRLEEALRQGQEGLALREKLGTAYETGLSLIDVGATHLELGHLDRAERLWQRALDIFTRYQARYEQAQLHFYLAVLAQRRDDAKALVAHLEQAVTLAHTYEHGDPPRCLHFLVEEAAWAAPLMAHALQRGFVPNCVDCLLPRLGRPACDALLPLLDDPDPAVRARAATLLGHLGDAKALKPLAARRRDPDPTVRRAIERALARLLSVPPPPLRAQTLGRFRLWRGDEEITRWPRRSARDVFLILLAHTPRPVPIERLMETLWPESAPDKARQNLRRAVSDLRRILEPELPAGAPSRYLRVERETYALILPPGSHVDDTAFEKALTQELAAPIPSTREGRQAVISRLETTLGRYTGDYLSELPYEDWALTRREYLRHLLISGAHLLAQLYLEAGQLENAIIIAHCALTQQPWDEEATLVLMRAYAALENTPAALQAYEAYRDRLQRDLDLPPRDDLTALYEQLRQR